MMTSANPSIKHIEKKKLGKHISHDVRSQALKFDREKILQEENVMSCNK